MVTLFRIICLVGAMLAPAATPLLSQQLELLQYEPYGQADSTIHYGTKGAEDSDRAKQEGRANSTPTTGHTTPNQSTHPKKQGPSLLSANGYNDTLNLHRLTDLADPRQLNTAIPVPILTWNPTVFMPPSMPLPIFRPDSSVSIAFCPLSPLASLGETTAPVPPFLNMPVTPPMFYDPRKGPGAPLNAFEHLASYPHFPRIAIWYDSLPYRTGLVWANFPDYATWDTLAPKGKIRNMKGHEVAVAWREHGGEPYHYSVMSYDERGRVEALLRYTESLGFDAVYYTYNSANLVTSVRVADPFRQYTTFYGYNYNGQVDSVWTHLESPGSGTVQLTPTMRADLLQRPEAWHRPDSLATADIAYQYTALGNVEHLKFPEAQITTDYWYNKRGWLDSLESQYTIVAPKIFQQKLWYDSVGRIIKQESKNGNQSSSVVQGYGYDNVDRLQKWYRSGLGDTVLYEYDKVGNRVFMGRIDGGDVRAYQYGQPGTGPNRLQQESITQPLMVTERSYSYNANGSVTDRLLSTPIPTPTLLEEDHLGYSYRELTWRYIAGNPNTDAHSDWRYRYNAMGEREQKRLYHAPLADSIAGQPYPWVYYLLGGSKDQLAVWHGQQMTSPFCDTVRQRNVFLYPTEYLTNGIGWNGVHEDITPIITKPDGSKEYRISDHLASLRVSLTSGTPTKYYDYDPWGGLLGGTTPPRRGFNDNEKDKENGLFSLGVRKYEEGRFLSIDPLFESEPEISPYVYAGNAPLNYVDPEGKQRQNTADPLRTIRLQLPSGRLYVGLPEHFAPSIPKYSYEHVGANQRAMEIRSQAARTGANAQPLPNLSARAGIATSMPTGAAANSAQTVATSAASAMVKPAIPNAALQVAEHARTNNGAAQSGYKGNRSFTNDGRGGGQVLPKTDANGNAVSYKEYDVNPYKKGVSRGAERVVIGSDNKAYYTNDHYKTFTEIQQQ